MSAIKYRNRKQVYKTDAYREHRSQIEKRKEADPRHFTRHLRNAQGPTELIRILRPDNHLPHIGQGARDHEPCLLGAFPQRHDGPIALDPDALLTATRDAKHADHVLAAETVLDLARRRSDLQRDRLAIP